MDLFWIYEERIINDCLIHLMRLKRRILLKMSMEEMHLYLKNEIVKDCIREYSIEKSLPMHNYLLEEKEVLIE